jgi:hypothetical protein
MAGNAGPFRLLSAQDEYPGQAAVGIVPLEVELDFPPVSVQRSSSRFLVLSVDEPVAELSLPPGIPIDELPEVMRYWMPDHWFAPSLQSRDQVSVRKLR